MRNFICAAIVVLTWAAFISMCWWMALDRGAFGSEDRLAAIVVVALMSAVFITLVVGSIPHDDGKRSGEQRDGWS